MAQYENRILHSLLDSYENSRLSRGENKITVHITFSFTKKTMPEYFDESSVIYEKIHADMKELEQKGYVKIFWKKGKENHIIQKIMLNEQRVDEIYQYLNRTSRAVWEEKTLRMLEKMKDDHQTPVAGAWIRYLTERIRSGKSVKEYIDLSDLEGTKRLLRVIGAIEHNTEECYIREFSIRCLSDTKQFQSMMGVVGKIMSRFREEFAEMDIRGILAEYSIYDTPNYVYLKGVGEVLVQQGQSGGIELETLKQGIGISGEDLRSISITGESRIRKIITIENLTTFFRWKEEEALLIYLGGYHNSSRRALLQMLYRQMPDKEYLHFGDIDVGGFEIYEDLRRKTGIPFAAYHMGVEELERYRAYTKKLTPNDRTRLQKMIEKQKETGCGYREVLDYMISHGVKLEQECVER